MHKIPNDLNVSNVEIKKKSIIAVGNKIGRYEIVYTDNKLVMLKYKNKTIHLYYTNKKELNLRLRLIERE